MRWGKKVVLNLIYYVMSKVRAKFECTGSKEEPQSGGKSVIFMVVKEGSEENKSFSKYTPSGDLHLFISDETEASNAFEVGKEYYLDIIEA